MNEHLKHMDVGSRNARLCATLQSMGLFVLPVFAESDPNQIDHMLVSVALPAHIEQPAESATGTPVTVPVSRSEVRMHVKPSECRGMGVIDFPAVLRERAVIVPADHATVAVDPVIGMSDDLSSARP